MERCSFSLHANIVQKYNRPLWYALPNTLRTMALNPISDYTENPTNTFIAVTFPFESISHGRRRFNVLESWSQNVSQVESTNFGSVEQ